MEFEENCFYKYKGECNKPHIAKYLSKNEVYKCVSVVCGYITLMDKYDNIFLAVGSDIKYFNKSGLQENNWERHKANFKFMNNTNNKVDHPSHYNQGGMEVIDQMVVLFGVEKVIAFCELNAYKYRMRAGYKDDIVQDINKATWYENKAKKLKKKLSAN